LCDENELAFSPFSFVLYWQILF